MKDEIVQKISIDKIFDPEHAMRSEIDRNSVWELADNIKQNGLINPITVRPKNGNYEVVAGHRRFSACKINGMVLVPCVIRELSDDEVFAVMAAENLERENVDPVDEAIFISRYMEQTKKDVAEVAKALRRSPAFVESRIAIGSMPDYMKGYLKSGDIKIGVALALVQIDDDRMRHMWVEQAVRDGISVAQAEYWLHGYKVNKLPGVTSEAGPPGDFVPAANEPPKFRCAIDGQLYDTRVCRTLIVAEENLSFFNDFVTAFRTPPAQN